MHISKLSQNVMMFIFAVLIVAAISAAVNNLPLFFLLLFLLFLLLILAYWISREPDYPPEEFYVLGEIIVRGPQAAVEAAVAAISQTFSVNELAEGDRIRFGDLPEDVRNCFGGCYGTAADDFVIDRYTFEVNRKDVAAVIRAIRSAVPPGSDVQAEPNWLSGHEWETAGSGWEPWDPEGSDDGTIYPADEADFINQWAFQQIGLNSIEEYPCGEHVRIGVFDTWPESEDNTPVVPGLLAGRGGPFRLRIRNVRNRYRLHAINPDLGNISYHGYFVAGLAQAVARSAEIDVYRVLNDNNLGDLFSLIQAIFDFIVENVPDNRPENQLGTVINLSLGIRLLPEASGIRLPLEVQTLRDVLRAARCAGIVVIAASGNRAENASGPAAADLPANWAEIIGVASSNKTMDRACFSNLGNVAAPGGDGRAAERNGRLLCEPANDSCTDSQCPYSVVGPYRNPYTGEMGYGFWSGTSFSAPMVAGLAACVIEKGQGRLSPDQVRAIIECGVTVVDDAALGAGIINIPKTLECLSETLDKA
jgi:subtilisin family serine protease